jgi:WD40 repeat protein
MRIDHRTMPSSAGLARWARALAFSLVALGVCPAHAAEPPTTPILRLETGMHTAPIWSIATDVKGHWLVTASPDKTARVWEIDSGRLLTVLRPPLGEGDEGKLHAVALSPDGATVALAGCTGWDWDTMMSIYLFDRTTGRLLRRVSGLPEVINHLAFSPGGHWLAVSLGGQSGVRVFEAASWRESGQDRRYGDSSHSADFSGDGRRMVTTSLDGRIRLYAVENGTLRRLAKTVAPGGKQPLFARFSPDGRQIAVGFNDTTAVNVLDAKTLSLAFAPDTRGVDNWSLPCVAWSADGKLLYAGGLWNVRDRYPVRRWSAGGRGDITDITLARETVMDLAPLPDGRVVFGAGDPSWGVISAQGQVLHRQDGAIAEFEYLFEGFQLSTDGLQVSFAYEQRGKSPAVFDLGGGGLGPDRTGLTAPITTAPGVEIANWDEKTNPSLNGQPLRLFPYERSQSIAIAPDGTRFALGADSSLRLYDRTGRELWNAPVPGVAWSVNISGDGRWVVAAYDDGTIRWHRVSDGQEVLALFPHADRRRWIAWTPEGFFDAAPGAEELIGYHLNRGKEQAGEFIAAKQLLERYYQPSLIAKRLTHEGDELIARAVKDLGDVRELLSGAGGATPLVELLSPADAKTDGEYLLSVRVKDQGGGVGRLITRIDGVEVAGRQAGIPGGDTVSRSFPLAAGRRVITVAAVNARGVESKPVQAVVEVTPPTERPALHVLAVGVTDYYDASLRLKHSAGDAQALASELEKRGKALFPRGVRVKVLADEAATVKNIEASFGDLAKDFKPEDTFVLFLAGHGQTSQEGSYTFLPYDIEYDSDAALTKQGFGEDRLREMMARMPARSLTLLDTCRSGSALTLAARAAEDKGAISRLARTSQRAIITASTSQGMALEGYENHGVLTFAVLKALGEADYDKDDRVSVEELALYIRNIVPKITEEKFKYRQIPMKELNDASFPIASPNAR